MSPETRRYLHQAHDLLDRGQRMAAAGLPEDAGRAGYLVALHAAQALIFARTGRVAKTHRGVRVEFARLSQAEPSLAPWLITFLARAYELKSIADYGTGDEAAVTTATAASSLAEAKRFLATIEALLNSPAPDGP